MKKEIPSVITKGCYRGQIPYLLILNAYSGNYRYWERVDAKPIWAVICLITQARNQGSPSATISLSLTSQIK